ncbi:OmpH family outer membrane protein [Balneolaceae bacterium ANBcel3]|nr:OmpH family outer membrane protein [Balneolaceae bacterium ANBcel3]
MKNASLFIGFLLLFSLFVQVDKASAQSDLRIGYVDPQVIMRSMPEMAAIERRLQNFIDRKRQEFAEKESTFRQRVEEYQQRAAIISEEAQRREEERLAELSLELQEFQQNFQQEIQERQITLLEPLLDKIQGAIDEVASERNLTYVLNTMTNNGDFIILYASEQAQRDYDITNAVMERLDLM